MNTTQCLVLKRTALGALFCATLALSACGGGGSDAALAVDASTSAPVIDPVPVPLPTSPVTTTPVAPTVTVAAPAPAPAPNPAVIVQPTPPAPPVLPPPPPPVAYSIGGTVTGLATGGNLVLQNNAGNNLNVTANGALTFSAGLVGGAGFKVSVLTQPVNQICSVVGGIGNVASANVGNVIVTCAGAVPRFAYVANSGDNTVSIYVVNAVTGQLRHNGYVQTINSPYFITIHPSNRFAYIADYSRNLVSVYSINAVTGALTPVPCTGPGCARNAFRTGAGPASVTIDAFGKFAYVANQQAGSVSAFTIDAVTGALASVGADVAAGGNATSVTVDPSGKFAYVANQIPGSVSAYTINAATGVLTQIVCNAACSGSNFNTGASSHSVTVDPSGRFAYVANIGGANVSVFAIHAVTGALTAIPGSPFATPAGPRSVTIDPSGKFAYVASSSGLSAFAIHATTGALTSAGAAVAAGSGIPSGTVDPSGKFAYVANTGSNDVSLYTINAATGALTAAGSVRARDGVYTMAMVKGTVPVNYTPMLAFVASHQGGNTTGTVSALTIDAATGALGAVAGSPFASGWSTQGLAANPAGTFAYVANYNSTLTAFSIAGSGALATLPGSPYAAPGGQFAWASAVDPSGRFVYYANYNNGGAGSVSGFTINAATGALTAVAGSAIAAGNGPRDIAIDPTGRFAYVTNALGNSVSAYGIDASTGVLTRLDADAATAGVQDFAAGLSPEKIAVDPSGRFVYVTNGGDSTVSIYAVDVASGALLRLDANAATAGIQDFPVVRAHALAFEPTGRFLYVTQVGGFDNVLAYPINPTTGTIAAAASTVATGANPHAITVDAAGSFAYVAGNSGNGVSVYRINGTTGALTAVTGSPFALPGATRPSAIVTTGAIQ